MAFQVERTHVDADDKPFIKQYKLFHATFAQFSYTGAQVAIASGFINYAVYAGKSNSTGSKLYGGAQGAFAIGRFFGSLLMKFVRPRWCFLLFITGAIVFIAPAIAHGGDTGIALLFVVLFFESICFPTIVALGMRGLGRHTKRGSGYIVGGVVGGACIPAATFALAEVRGNSMAMLVPLLFFLVAFSYALCVNFAPRYKKVVDSFTETEVGLHGHTEDPENPAMKGEDLTGAAPSGEAPAEEKTEEKAEVKAVS